MPFGALGFLVTAVFLPDTTGLDLREQERASTFALLALESLLTRPLPATGYWRCVRAGHPEQYHGIAIHPQHLSWYERVVLKRDRFYDPVQDRIDRIDELRVMYESHLIAREDATGASYDPDHSFISADVERYFALEQPVDKRVKRQITKEAAIRGEFAANEKVHRSALEESLGGRV